MTEITEDDMENNEASIFLGYNNVGIGTNSPDTRLQVHSNSIKYSDINATADSEDAWNQHGFKLTSDNNSINFITSNKHNDRQAMIQAGHSSKGYANYLSTLAINPFGGNVGIGTTAPAARLHVESSNREDSINRVCPAGTLWASFFDGNADHDWNGDSILDGRDYGALDGIDANDYLEDNECVVFGTSTGNAAGATPASGEFWIDTDLDREVDAGEIITEATTTLDGDAVVAATPNKCEDGYVWLNQRVDAGDEPVAGECIAPQLDENSDISRVDFTGESCPTGTQKRDENEDGNTDDGECHIPALFVQSDGDVGVGTTVPESELHIGKYATVDSQITSVDSIFNNASYDVLTIGNDAGGSADSWATSAAGLRFQSVGNNQTTFGTRLIQNIDQFDIWTGSGAQNHVATFDSNGNVGIGTTSPGAKLDVRSGSISAGIQHDNSNRYGLLGYRNIDNSDSSALGGYAMESESGIESPILFGYDAGANYDNKIRFSSMTTSDRSLATGLQDRMVIDMTSGNVGIGTTSPDAKLEIINGQQEIQFLTGDNTSRYSGYISLNDDGMNIGNNSTSRGFNLKNANGSLFSITPYGNVTIVGTVTAGGETLDSDIRYKKDIQTLPSALKNILSLRGVSYYWKDRNDNTQQIGVIAQEVEKIYPQLVHTNEDGYKSVAYSNLVSPLIEAVKELHALYQGHADRIAALETQNAHQDERIAHQDELIVQLEEQNVGLLKTVVQLEVRLAALEAAQ